MPLERFPRAGLTYFWFLNSDCPVDHLRRQIAAFAEAGVECVVLHPREGLLVPYLGRDWIDLVRELALALDEVGIESWLYDEDYCPSGNAGGRVLAEQPQFQARAISRIEPPEPIAPGELFVFPCGPLLWAGAVGPRRADPVIDLTDRVGMLRRHWEYSEWDSRYYYSGTPLYPCPRSGAHMPEYAIRMPALPPGYRPVAFVALPVGTEGAYTALVDPLNPLATEALLKVQFDRYENALGDLFGKPITAIFTDEPKYHGTRPWTPDLVDDFARRFGYDLRERLSDLFTEPDDPAAMLTRIHYRQWLGERFHDAWLKPLAQWCRQRGLRLVGHMSPEDDIAHQSACLTNLIPLQKSLDLPGLDVIIPAVGDADHAILNVGVTLGSSCAQQQDKPGACSEILGASGLGDEIDTRRAATILAWQVMSGVCAPVVHGAYASTLGLRLYDAGPDWGPHGRHWQGMLDIDRGLRPFIEIVTDSTQVAPVALLWPIRGFNAMPDALAPQAQTERARFDRLLLSLLARQVGVHLLDEADLLAARFEQGEIRLGRARYRMVLVPRTTVLHQDTITRLNASRDAGVDVVQLDSAPAWVQTDDGLDANPTLGWDTVPEDAAAATCAERIGRLVPIDGSHHEAVRVTRWDKDGESWALVMNLDMTGGHAMRIGTLDLDLAAGELTALRRQGNAWQPMHRFVPGSVRPTVPPAPTLPLTGWELRFADEDWQPIKTPGAMYQFRPVYHKPDRYLAMTLTGGSVVGGAPTAAWAEFRANLSVPADAKHVELILEPTAARGRITVHLGSHQWSHVIRDTDSQPTVIDLSGRLEPGDHPIVFHLREPMSFDGLRVPPTIRLRASR